jgi:hypothetical protein
LRTGKTFFLIIIPLYSYKRRKRDGKERETGAGKM